MAANIVLKIEGIKGESKEKGHENEIDVLSVSWGASNATSVHFGGGAGTSKVNVHDLTITKRVDKASPELFLKTCEGKHLKNAKLVFRKAGGDSPVDYMTYEMENVFITGVQQSGGGDQFAMENVSLSFEIFKLEYKPQSEKGAAESPVKTGWNIAKNEKA